MPQHEPLHCSQQLRATYLPKDHDDPRYKGGRGFGDGVGGPFPLRNEDDKNKTAWMDPSLATGGNSNFYFDYGEDTIALELRFPVEGDWRARPDASEIVGKGQWKLGPRGKFDRTPALKEVPPGASRWEVSTRRGFVPITNNEESLVRLERDFCDGAGHLNFTYAYRHPACGCLAREQICGKSGLPHSSSGPESHMYYVDFEQTIDSDGTTYMRQVDLWYPLDKRRQNPVRRVLAGLDELVRRLNMGGGAVKELTAGALSSLASTGMREGIVDAGGIGAITKYVEVLRIDEAGLNMARRARIQTAVEVLAKLPGAIDPLVRLLGDDEPPSLSFGAQRNWSFSVSKVQEALADLGAIEPIIALLRSGSDNAKQRAALLLVKTASKNSDSAKAIVDAKGVEPLLTLLSDASKRKGRDDDAVWRLETTLAAVHALALLPGAIQPLAKLLPSCPDVDVLAIEEAFVQRFVELLCIGSDAERGAAADAIASLSLKKEGKENFARMGAFAPLTKLLCEGGSQYAKQAAAETAKLVARWNQLTEGVPPEDGPLRNPDNYNLNTRTCNGALNQETKGCTGLYASFYDRAEQRDSVELYVLPLHELPEKTEDYPTPHLRCLLALQRNLIKDKALMEGDKLRFCIGFAIDANGYLQKRSCANEQTFGTGRALPEEQYESLYQMLKDKHIRCHKQV